MNSSINITDIIAKSINTLFSNLFSSIDNNIYSTLDEITFINTDIISDNLFKEIFGLNSNSGILLISNSLVIGFVLYYLLKLLISHFSLVNIEKPFQFLFRLVLCTILMNFSLFICEQIININSLLSLSIREIGEILFNTNINFSELINKLNSVISFEYSNFNLFSLDGLMKSFISIELIVLLLNYSLRYILVKIFILISPFAFLSLVSNSTSWIFKSWIKSFISLLILQSFISIILLLIFSINIDSETLLFKLLYMASLYSLTKINSYIRDLIGGISTDFSENLYTLKSLIK